MSGAAVCVQRMAIIGYSSICTNKVNRAILARFPAWRWMLSTRTPLAFQTLKDTYDFSSGYAVDNGAYSDYLHGRPFQTKRFLQLLALFGDGADWVVIPDVVANREATLDAAREWIPRLTYRKLFVVQDGMGEHDIRPFTDDIEGVFLGGSTEWKLRTMPYWCDWGVESKKICHVGRVNTLRRLQMAVDFKATSFDGSATARFREEARRMTGYMMDLDRQVPLFGD
jgi:hypothetical protein